LSLAKATITIFINASLFIGQAAQLRRLPIAGPPTSVRLQSDLVEYASDARLLFSFG
jgi:hypothetical protein